MIIIIEDNKHTHQEGVWGEREGFFFQQNKSEFSECYGIREIITYL